MAKALSRLIPNADCCVILVIRHRQVLIVVLKPFDADFAAILLGYFGWGGRIRRLTPYAQKAPGIAGFQCSQRLSTLPVEATKSDFKHSHTPIGIKTVVGDVHHISAPETSTATGRVVEECYRDRQISCRILVGSRVWCTTIWRTTPSFDRTQV